MNQAEQSSFGIEPKLPEGHVDLVCEVCDREFGGTTYEQVCGRQRCLKVARARRWAAGSKLEVFRGSCVPEQYRATFDPDYHGSWPKNEKTGADSGQWAGDPPFVTLAGVNFSGKSTLAAEMMYWCIARSEGAIDSAFWVRPAQLVEEHQQARFGTPRALAARARRAGILVVDEFCFDMSDACLTRSAELVEHRYSSCMPTIFTTHRPVNRGEGCIRELAPMLFERIAQGWVIEVKRPERRNSC